MKTEEELIKMQRENKIRRVLEVHARGCQSIADSLGLGEVSEQSIKRMIEEQVNALTNQVRNGFKVY